MAIVHSKFSLGLPNPEGESRFWEKSTNQNYSCLIFSVVGKTARETSASIEKFIQSTTMTDAQSLFEVVSTIETRCQENNVDVSVVGVIVENQKLYLASLNGGVFLVRGSKRGALLTSQPIVQVLQGVFKQADVLVIYTNSVQEQIQLLFSKGFAFDQIQALAQEFQRAIRKMNHSETMAAAFIASPKESENESNELPTVVVKKKQIQLLNIFKSGLTLGLEAIKSSISFLLWFIGSILRKSKKSEQSAQRTSLAKLLLHPAKTYVGVHITRKQLVALIIFLISTLLITITIVVTHYKSLEVKEQLAEKLIPYQQTLSDLEKQAETAPAQAYLGVQQLIQNLSTLESEYLEPQSAHKQVLLTLQQAQNLAQQLYESQAIEQLPIFDDLRKISPTFITSSSSSNNGNLIALDAQQQYVISYSLADKIGKEVVLDSTNQLRVVTSTEKMFLALGGGVFALSTLDSQLGINELLETSDAVTNSQLIGGYENFVYLLSSESRAIFRYELKSGKLVNRATWIGSSSGVPFGDSVSMVVDGDIWLGTNAGQITRMRSGRTVEFTVAGLSEPFESTLLLATSLESPNLYVLEPKKSRVVVLNKDTGEVVNQIQNRTLGSANTIIYDESQQLVLVVSGSILYRMPL